MFISFVADYQLELRAALLAASLRECLGKEPVIRVGVPKNNRSGKQVTAGFLKLCETIAIELAPIAPPFGTSHLPAANIATLALACGPALLLDTNVLCLSTPKEINTVRSEVAAKPADVISFNAGQAGWDTIYARYHLRSTPRRVITTFAGELSHPYFDAGVIYVNEPQALASEWMRMALQLAADKELQAEIRRLYSHSAHDVKGYPTYPRLDEISLPLAIQQLGWKFTTLSERSNFPLHLRTLSHRVESAPSLVRYHSFEVLVREPSIVEHLKRLVGKYAVLADLISAHPAPLLTKALVRPRCKTHAGRNWIVTGIPRSGTSLMCRLIDEQKNCIALNEPREAQHLIRSTEYSESLKVFYADIRRSVWLGLPIENKLHDGLVTADTAVSNNRATYHPTVDSANFVLATKNTLVYLSRLSALRRTRATFRVICLIRDPIATISSWRRLATVPSFGPLGSGDIHSLLNRGVLHVGGGWETRSIAEMTDVTDRSVRLALLWRHLARLIRDNEDWIEVVRYEELAKDPNAILCRLLAAELEVTKEQPVIPAGLKISVPDHAPLEPDEQAIIRDMCADAGASFGYELR